MGYNRGALRIPYKRTGDLVEREDIRVISVVVLAILFMLGSFISAKLLM